MALRGASLLVTILLYAIIVVCMAISVAIVLYVLLIAILDARE